MHVFVTGGSGFVGGHLIEALVRAGHRVRALARSDASAAVVERWGAESVRGDLDTLGKSELTCPREQKVCDAVVHSAAYVEEWGTRAQFWHANVDGTTRVIEAARGAGVKRFVHVGTEAAVFDGHDLVDIDETHPYPARQRFLYSETKAEAERRVLAADSPGFTTISIRPRFVWGPRDNTVLPAIVRRAQVGRFAWIDGGAKLTSTTHIANLIPALVLALDHGRGGNAYFVSDDGTRTFRDFLGALLRTQGVEPGSRNVPRSIARALAAIVEAPWRWFGIRSTPPITRLGAAMMSATVTLRTDKARAELGWAPVIDVARGIEQMPKLDS